MKTEIKEVSKLPSLLIYLFAIQLIIFLFMFLKMKNPDLEIFYILAPITLLLLIIKMTITFELNKIQYKLFPFHLKSKELKYLDIKELKITKIDALTDFGGWGLRYSRNLGWGYIFGSNDALTITLKNNKKLTFTIKDKTIIMNFLDENNISYTK